MPFKNLYVSVVEDDLAQAELLRKWLEEAGCRCRCFERGKPFLLNVCKETYDLVLLDWNLPDIDGHGLLEQLRTDLQIAVPVIFITSRESEQDIVRALEAGADDYLIKPIRKAELLARMHAIHRRAFPPEQATHLDFGTYLIDLEQHRVLRFGIPVELTAKEYELAVFLFRNAGRIISRSQLLTSVWASHPDLYTRTVDMHISHLRRKLGLGAETGWRLSSVYNRGYRLEAADLSSPIPSAAPAA